MHLDTIKASKSLQWTFQINQKNISSRNDEIPAIGAKKKMKLHENWKKLIDLETANPITLNMRMGC